MTNYDRALAAASVVLIIVLLAGLVVRRRLGSCVSFVAYLLAVGVADALVFTWPERFFRQSFWIFKESVQNALKLAIAVELMVRIFRHFPAAYHTVLRWVLVVLLGLGVLIAFALPRGTEYVTVVGRLHPHVNDGTVWVLLCVGAFCVWYHLPLDSIHKAILIGLIPYLLLYSVVQRAIGALGWERGDLFNLTAPHAYLCVLVYWIVVAWRKRLDGDAGTRVARLMDKRKK
jgi:hypothetical protein